ncbi:MAG: hypothetical protein FWF37_03130 [Chloroflexi bacterium]|nr:hypothetical protein [Chloroflexota bacterium]
MFNEQFGGFYEFNDDEIKTNNQTTKKNTSFADYQNNNKEPEIVYSVPYGNENMPEIDDYISDEVFMDMQSVVQGKYEKQFIAMYTLLQNTLNLAFLGDKENPVNLDNLFKLVDKRSEALFNDARMQNLMGRTHLKPADIANIEGFSEENVDIFAQETLNYFTKINPEDIEALGAVRTDFKDTKTTVQKRTAIFAFFNINPSHPNLLLPVFNIPQDCTPIEAYLAQAIAGINEVRAEKGN